MSLRRVVVTGLAAVTPFGIGIDKYDEGLFAGRSASTLITSFDAAGFPTRFAASVPATGSELDLLVKNQKSTKTMSRAMKFAVLAADAAVTDAGLQADSVNPFRVGTAIGAGGIGLSDFEYNLETIQIFNDLAALHLPVAPNEIWRTTMNNVNPLTALRALPNIMTAHVAINHNARGPCLTISTACTSSAQAIGEAFRQIQTGTADVMICGGSDSMVNPTGLLAFSALGVLSKNNDQYQTAARPFDRRRDGFMIGEGAAMMVLEDWDSCRRRGKRPYAEILGYANTCDAYRLTDEPPGAWGSVEAMRSAISNSGIQPRDVDYINVHGTGTRMNDRSETHAITQVFGDSPVPPLSSTKSMIGHLVAAAGAVEFAACLLALEHQRIPPTINFLEPDPECNVDCVPNHSREARLNRVLSNSFGFGGQNACLVAQRIL